MIQLNVRLFNYELKTNLKQYKTAQNGHFSYSQKYYLYLIEF